jgi:integrase
MITDALGTAACMASDKVPAMPPRLVCVNASAALRRNATKHRFMKILPCFSFDSAENYKPKRRRPSMKLALDAVPPPRGNIDSRYFFWSGISKPNTLKARIHEILSLVFKESGVQGAHAHRFRHTLATELLGRGASFEEVADILGNSPEIVWKHYGKWSAGRQSHIDELMERVYIGPDRVVPGKTIVQ